MQEEQLSSLDRTRLLSRWFSAHWWLSVVVAFVLIEARMFFPIQPTRDFRPDSAIFLLGGDLLTAGYAPYLNLWDVKPPLIYDTTGLIALLAPGDPWTQFYLGSALTMLMATVVIALAGIITRRVTNSTSAAFVTAVTIVGYYQFAMHPAYGIFPKYFTLAFGLAGLWASLEKQHVLAAVLATVAAGYWQWGAIFTILVYARAWYSSGSTDWRRMVLASVIVTIIAVGPVVLAGAGIPMIKQVLFDIFLFDETGQSIADRIHKFTDYMGFVWPLVAAGVVGAFETAYRQREHYWLLAGVSWPIFQIAFVDFDSSPDVFMLLVFAAIALGITVGTLRLSRHQLAAVVCVALLLSGGQLYDHRGLLQTQSESKVTTDALNVSGAFLDQRLPPDDCRVSAGSGITKELNERSNDQRCGTQLPFG